MLIGLVGDVLINRADPDEVFTHVREVLKSPDVLIGNLEGCYSDERRAVPGAYHYNCGPSSNLDAYAKAGFHVMSLANNHILDIGHAVMLENRSRLQAQGIQTCGAGGSI